MLFLNNFKSILILGGVIAIVAVALALSLTQPITPSPTPPETVQIPLPTSFPEMAPPSISPTASVNNVFNTYSEQYKEEQKVISTQEQPIHDQALTISAFIDKLPTTGKFIKVTYNIYNNQVYLEYTAGNKDAALKEFVDLLKANGIENINWLYNLQIVER